MSKIFKRIEQWIFQVWNYHIWIFQEGSKGITEEYTSKSGKKRTAKKIREEHIV